MWVINSNYSLLDYHGVYSCGWLSTSWRYLLSPFQVPSQFWYTRLHGFITRRRFKFILLIYTEQIFIYFMPGFGSWLFINFCASFCCWSASKQSTDICWDYEIKWWGFDVDFSFYIFSDGRRCSQMWHVYIWGERKFACFKHPHRRYLQQKTNTIYFII